MMNRQMYLARKMLFEIFEVFGLYKTNIRSYLMVVTCKAQCARAQTIIYHDFWNLSEKTLRNAVSSTLTNRKQSNGFAVTIIWSHLYVSSFKCLLYTCFELGVSDKCMLDFYVVQPLSFIYLRLQERSLRNRIKIKTD